MLLVLAMACHSVEGKDSVAGSDVLDLREDYPGPEGDGFQVASPDLLVPAHSEIFYCYYGTWNGGDAAVDLMRTWQVLPYNHHNQLKFADDSGPADGTLTECEVQDSMNYRPFVDGMPPFDIPGGEAFLPDEDLEDMLLLPEGYAVKLDDGRRWVLDSHYVNTSDQDVLLNAAINIGFTDMASVTRWVGVLQLDAGPPDVPPGEFTRSFDCAWPTDLEILAVTSHMHARGTAYAVDSIVGDVTTRVHEVPAWTDAYREYPRIDVWPAGEFTVSAGDTMRTTCSWYNETDTTISFPDEMCTTLVMAAPLEAPLLCDAGAWR